VPVRIVLADDHNMVRQGLRAILESQENFSVIGEARDGLEAVALVEKTKPDVIVLDLMLPHLSGLEVTRQVAKITHVLILTMHDNEAYVLEALWNGAFGYLLKDSTAQELIDAVNKVANGSKYLSASLTERAIDIYSHRAQPTSFDPYDTLTTREREIFQLVAEGLSNTEISTRLCISPRTVEIHKANTLHKLNLTTQTEVVKYAIRRGILPMEG
jgi:two-component system, NarL family, response regulator NreC